MKIEGYVSKAELNWYKKADIEKDDAFTPFILEVWKDESDYRDCVKGVHLQKVTITVK